MPSSLTITLPPKLRRTLARSAKQQGLSESEVIQRALQQQLWSDAFDATRRQLIPQARALGIYTDEDVFRIIS